MDLESGGAVLRHRGIGSHAHGIVLWQQDILCLDSEGGALVSVERDSGSRSVLWRVRMAGLLGFMHPHSRAYRECGPC